MLHRLLPWFLVLALAFCFGCQPPTESDGAQAARTLLIGGTWYYDKRFPSDPVQFTAHFEASGKVVFNGGHAGTWSFEGNTFTIHGPYGTWTTVSPVLTEKVFVFLYYAAGQYCHLTRDSD